MSCVASTNGCLDLRRHSFTLSGQVSAEWSRCLGSSGMACKRLCNSFAMKLSRLDACKNRMVVRCCRMQASSHNLHGVVDSRVDEAGMNTAAPDRSAAFCG